VDAADDSNFLHLITPDSATGHGTVTYSVENNTAADARVAALTIADIPAVVTQHATVPQAPPPAVPNTPNPGHSLTGVTCSRLRSRGARLVQPASTCDLGGRIRRPSSSLPAPPRPPGQAICSATRSTTGKSLHEPWGNHHRAHWSFRTTAVAPPAVGREPTPPNDAIGIISPTLTWSALGAATYDVHFGTIHLLSPGYRPQV
jgi:hypothetical protein